MASRKDLKKNVSCIISELLTECLIRREYVPGTDKETVDSIISELIEADEDFTCRISHTEPGMAAKAYYRAFYSDFNKKIEELIGKIEKLGAR